MSVPRISASSYSNTAPLIWSFLYGANRGKYELILDNAPARSAELLANKRVDAALVPVVAYQLIEGVKLVPNVCVGAQKKARSVCLATKGEDLRDVKTVALDVSSKTSVVLTKLLFKEFLGFEPTWTDAKPDLETMLSTSDAALLIGDPALMIDETRYQKFDLAGLWHQHTGLGFVFAMWMTRRDRCEIDFAAARDEGLAHADNIATNYAAEIGLSRDEMKKYLTENISYSIDESMKDGLDLYFKLAERHGLIHKASDLSFI